MQTTLDDLITAAVQLAGQDAVSCGARLWQSEGGRACPLGWGGCSQTVYMDIKTGEYDYGEIGGPGHADCKRHCRHGMHPVPDDDPNWLPNDGRRETPNVELTGADRRPG